MKGFDKGDRVVHPQYGAGTVSDANELRMVIDFDEHGVRKFVTSMVSLEPTQIPAPQRPVKATKRASRARTNS